MTYGRTVSEFGRLETAGCQVFVGSQRAVDFSMGSNKRLQDDRKRATLFCALTLFGGA